MKIVAFTRMPFWLMAMFLLAGSTSWTDPVASESARMVVQGWLTINPCPLETRLGHTIDRVSVYPDSAGPAAWYVVDLRPAGFVIVPADDWLEPILAFAPRGRFDPSPRHPLGALVAADLKARLAAVQRVRQTLRAGPLPAGCRANHDQWRALASFADAGQRAPTILPTISEVRISPLVRSVWDQEEEGSSYCYNYFTPHHYPCGCGPTAVAQVMRYHQYPTAGVGPRTFEVTVENDPNPYQTLTLLGGDGLGGAYNWSIMPLDPDSATPDYQRQAIGALCHDVGAAVQARYGPVGTSSDVAITKDAMKSVFYYSNVIMGYNMGSTIPIAALQSMLNPNLDAGLPLILGIDGPPGGHAVVCDGYGYDHGTMYHHVNLGWGAYDAADNAWYTLPLVDAVGATFDAVDVCLYNIFTTESGEIISGRITDSDGQPVTGATVTLGQSGGISQLVASDLRGIYAFTRLPSSSAYTLSVAKLGYSFTSRTAATGRSTDYQNTCGNQWGIDFTGTGGGGPTPDVSNQTALADYDGDRKADPAIYQTSTGRWYVWLSSQNYGRIGPFTFSQVGYTAAVPADYDGDGRADPAVFQAVTGRWFIWLSSLGYLGLDFIFFYQADYTMPGTADYDGDYYADPAVYRPDTGEWYVWLSSAGYSGLGPCAFSRPDYTAPAPADYDGDHCADPAVFQTATGQWCLWMSAAGYAGAGPYAFGQFGQVSPAPGDCDGDGLADPAIFSPATGYWMFWLSSCGYAAVGPLSF